MSQDTGQFTANTHSVGEVFNNFEFKIPYYLPKIDFSSPKKC